MQRRRLLKVGLASAAALAITGGTLAWMHPGLRDSRLSPTGRTLFQAIGAAVLQGTLPGADPSRSHALDSLVDRIEALVQGLPSHAQSELSQLLALLASPPGRVVFMAMASDWGEASIREVQQGLQRMRASRIPIFRQAYHALHDIVGGAYFSDPSTWELLGYPGPRKV